MGFMSAIVEVDKDGECSFHDLMELSDELTMRGLLNAVEGREKERFLSDRPR